MLKDHTCGELTAAQIGQEVRLAGWVHRRRDHGGLIFLDIRDRWGLVQVVFDPRESADAYRIAEAVRSEWVLAVRGTVARRPAGTENPRLPTGEVEVRALQAEVLNPSKTPPFYISEELEIDEALRLRYRYLDLRRARMARNLELRHKVVKFIRDFLDARGFWEVETPILIKSTPEGARDYLVPSRVYPGHFYALPQSPQQLKQLLMVAGVERYFQIARCFRDEDLRADRQPEFTQLDLEMSFVEEEDILGLMEELYIGLVRAVAPAMKVAASPFPRLTYREAMDRYGSDKPDLRFGLELGDLSDLAGRSGLGIFMAALEQGGIVKGLAAPGYAGASRREMEEMTEIARGRGARGLVTIALEGEPGAPVAVLTPEGVRSAVARHLSIEQVREMGQRLNARLGDLLLIVAAPPPVANAALSALRTELGRRLSLADPQALAFAFVTEFPLFEWNAEQHRWDSAHHPFTAPHPADRERLEAAFAAFERAGGVAPSRDLDLAPIRSRAYDLVVNGMELASGSIRVHQRELQERLLGLLGYSVAQAQERFGHLLEALEFGAPPHGGIAPGIDRTVAILAGEPTIREVIPFPKTQTAQDLMTGAPSLVDPAQLDELHLAIHPA
ncbi:MAG: aspartate--tRNA ligase [Chloroflexi bacterium]|nr:aspartate--tRNA ligase [Chloroflexota bacterium]